MAEPAQDLSLLPGLDMVGRGVYLKPQQPFELRGLLFHRDSRLEELANVIPRSLQMF